MTAPLRYFGYGSNLNQKDWARFCARKGHRPDSLKPDGAAWLPDHRPVYHYHSVSRLGGALDITPDLGHATPGMLFQVDADGWEALDAKEGTRYAKQTVTVLTEDGERHPAVTYAVFPQYRQSGFVAPTTDYADLVASGLRESKLPTATHEQAAAGQRPAPAVGHLFVYGLLQSNQPLGQRLDGIGHRQPARAPGRLFDLGAYPGWQPPSTPDDWVHGELLELAEPEMALAEADAIEGFHGYAEDALYHRVLIRAVTADSGSILAWCYRYARPLDGQPVPGGRWTRT